MQVAALWRYPVKSLRGEALSSAELTVDGIPGDRGLVVHDAGGRLVTARTRSALLGLPAVLGPGGEALISGRPWDSAEAGELIEVAAGEGARLVPAPRPERFDDTPLLVATDGALEFLELSDERRLRPNIVLSGVDGLAERDWPGGRLRIGDAVIKVWHVCERCVVTTLNPDDPSDQDTGVLRRINETLDKRVALNCSVEAPGTVAVADSAELL